MCISWCVGVLIKWIYEMQGATIKIAIREIYPPSSLCEPELFKWLTNDLLLQAANHWPKGPTPFVQLLRSRQRIVVPSVSRCWSDGWDKTRNLQGRTIDCLGLKRRNKRSIVSVFRNIPGREAGRQRETLLQLWAYLMYRCENKYRYTTTMGFGERKGVD